MASSNPLIPTAERLQDALVLPVVEYGDLCDLVNRNSPYFRYLGGVYSGGRAVPGALLVRPGMGTSTRPNGEWQGPEVGAARVCDGDAILCGRLFRHFAHFIGESLARIWYVKQHPESMLVWTGAEDYLPYQRQILDLLGIENPAVFVREPMRFERLTVPSQGHCMVTFYAPYYLEALGVVEPAPILPGRKTYISRAGDHGGGYANEVALQSLLQDAGWDILYPERMPFAERSDALSSSEVILMVEGSAMTSFLFYRALHSRVVTLARGFSDTDPGYPSFRDYFGAIARDKGLDYARLNLPKRWIGGVRTAARFELDLDAFAHLMQATDYLSTNLQAIEPLNEVYPHGKDEDTRLASRALDAVTTVCDDVAACVYRGGLHASAGALDEALAEIGNALTAAPDSAYLHWLRADLQQRSNNLPAARDALLRALALSREDTFDAHMQLAKLLRDLDDLPEAIAEARAAIALSPALPMPHMLLADLLLRARDLEGALAASRRAVELSPMNAQAHGQLSKLLLHQHDLDGAIAAARSAIRCDQGRPALHAHLARLLRENGEFAEARAAARAALAINPSFGPASAELPASRNLLHRLRSGLRRLVARPLSRRPRPRWRTRV